MSAEHMPDISPESSPVPADLASKVESRSQGKTFIHDNSRSLSGPGGAVEPPQNLGPYDPDYVKTHFDDLLERMGTDNLPASVQAVRNDLLRKRTEYEMTHPKPEEPEDDEEDFEFDDTDPPQQNGSSRWTPRAIISRLFGNRGAVEDEEFSDLDGGTGGPDGPEPPDRGGGGGPRPPDRGGRPPEGPRTPEPREDAPFPDRKKWVVKEIMREGYGKRGRERDYRRVKELFEKLKELQREEATWNPIDDVRLQVTEAKEQLKEIDDQFKIPLNELRDQKSLLDVQKEEFVALGIITDPNVPIDINAPRANEPIKVVVEYRQDEYGRKIPRIDELTLKQFADKQNKFDLAWGAIKVSLKEAREPITSVLARDVQAAAEEALNEARAAAIVRGEDPNSINRDEFIDDYKKRVLVEDDAEDWRDKEDDDDLYGVDIEIRKGELLKKAQGLLWDERLGTIHFSDEDRQQIEGALGQYIDFIESKIGLPDPERVLSNLKRIREIVARAHRNEGMSKEVAEILADNADARLVMFIHNEIFAAVGNVDACASLKAYFWKDRGKERTLALFETIKTSGYKPEILMKALDLIGNDPKFMAIYRPYGPRGELVNANYTQGYLRRAATEELVEELMHWDIKGAEPTTDSLTTEQEFYRNDRIKRVNRRKITWHQQKEKEEVLYVRYNGEKWVGESDGAYASRKSEVKKAAELALAFNLFLGQQAEMRGASVIAENGDLVHRRDAERLINYAIRGEMEVRGLSPLDVQKMLRSGADQRTKRMRDFFGEIIDEALDVIEEDGNNAIWIVRDKNGREIRRANIEDISKMEEVRVAEDAFLAVDYSAAAVIFSEENRRRAERGDTDYYPMIRRILDPGLKEGEVKEDAMSKRRVALLVDFTKRIQTESSQELFKRFARPVITKDGKERMRMHQGSLGAGYLTEIRIYDMRSQMANNYIENIKYGFDLIAYLPEIYSMPMSFACATTKELVQTIRLTSLKAYKKIPEVLENFSGEKLADEYRLFGTLRKILMGDEEKGGVAWERGFFHDPFASREKFLHSMANGIGLRAQEADEWVEKLMKDHFPKLNAIIELYRNLMNNTIKMESADSYFWAMGIFYDEFINWITSEHDSKDARFQGGLKAYERFRKGILVLKKKDRLLGGTGKFVWQKLKEKLVYQMTRSTAEI